MQPRDNADSASMMCSEGDLWPACLVEKSSCDSKNRALYSNALADPRRDSLYALPWSDYVRRGRLQLSLQRVERSRETRGRRGVATLFRLRKYLVRFR